MGRLRALVVKEVRELLRERLVLVGMIIMPALIMAFMGGLQGVAVKKTVQQAAKPLHILIVFDSEPTANDTRLASILAGEMGATLETRPYRGDPAELLSSGGYSAVVVLHRGFAENFTEGLPVAAGVYVAIPSPTPMAQAFVERVTAQLTGALRALIASRVHEVFPKASASFLVEPLKAETTIVVWGREVPAHKYTGYILSLYGVPLALLILLTSATQVGAISMGLEREAKTLEMLLASPVTARDVVLSKILGVLAVTLIGGASFALGFLVYSESLRSAMGAAVPGLTGGLTPGATAVALATLVMDLYIAAVLGLILGLGAQDVKGAQMVANYFSFLLLIPYLAVFIGFVPSPTGPLGAALLADPLYPPLIALLGTQFGRPGVALAALAVQAGHLALWSLVALRLLEPERLVAGIPLLSRLAQRRLPRAGGGSA